MECRYSPAMVNDAPRFDPASAQRIARELFAFDAVATPLTSERDQNFLLTTASGERHVLKVANALERADMVDAQQAAMARVASQVAFVPRPIATVGGTYTGAVRGDDGRTHLAWAITHLPGAPLGTLRHRPASLLEGFGEAIASLGGPVQSGHAVALGDAHIRSLLEERLHAFLVPLHRRVGER